MKLHQSVLDGFCPLRYDDENPMSPSKLENLLLLVRLADVVVLLDQWCFLLPVNELALVKNFWREVDRSVKPTLRKVRTRSHINDESNLFVVVHVGALLSCGHPNLHCFVCVKELAHCCDRLVLNHALDSR